MANEFTPEQEEKVRELIKKALDEDGEVLFCSYGQPSSFWSSPKTWVFVPRALVEEYRPEHDAMLNTQW